MTDTRTIGAVARSAGINPRTLRYYERIGLLVPSARTDAGYRLYTDRDAGRLSFIRRAQALGLSLTEIADVIALREAGTTPCRHVSTVARAKVAVIDERIAELQALREELTRLAERAEAVENTCADDSSSRRLLHLPCGRRGAPNLLFTFHLDERYTLTGIGLSLRSICRPDNGRRSGSQRIRRRTQLVAASRALSPASWACVSSDTMTTSSQMSI